MQQPLHLLPVIGGLLSPVVLPWVWVAQKPVTWTLRFPGRLSRRHMSAPGLGCTRAPGRRVPCTVRGFAPRAGLGDWDFTGERPTESAYPVR